MFRRLLLGSLIATAALMSPAGSFAGDAHHESKPGSAEFERVKSLVGTWQGTTSMGQQGEMPATVTYHLTSAGSAVVETLFPGTPHEMVSVYHDRGGKLSLTHYCAMGNVPELGLSASTPTQLQLVFSGGDGIEPANDHYMHSLTIDQLDADHLAQTWTSQDHGQPTESTVLTLTRSR